MFISQSVDQCFLVALSISDECCYSQGAAQAHGWSLFLPARIFKDLQGASKVSYPLLGSARHTVQPHIYLLHSCVFSPYTLAGSIQPLLPMHQGWKQ